MALRCSRLVAGPRGARAGRHGSLETRCAAAGPERAGDARVGWAAAGAAALHAAAPLAVLLDAALAPPPAEAVLVSANTKLPRSASAALRRAIPTVNKETADVQAKVEEVAFFLRIPQRKPWGQMADDVRESVALVQSGRAAILKAVPEGQVAEAEAALDKLAEDLAAMEKTIQIRDPDLVSIKSAAALDDLSKLEILQAPGLPFLLPPKYAATYPLLTGRATVAFVMERPGGAFDLLGGEPAKTLDFEVELDGYSAPLTAGNLAQLVSSGFYDGAELEQGDFSMFVKARKQRPRGAAPDLPLEFKPMGQFEPQYRLPLDVQGGEELPVLPFSVYGAVAMGLSPDDSTLADPSAFFFHLFDRRSSGLGGLSFEEGAFPVAGYVTKGERELAQLRTGDRIRSAKVVAGLDRLQLPAGAMDAAEDTAEAPALS